MKKNYLPCLFAILLITLIVFAACSATPSAQTTSIFNPFIGTWVFEDDFATITLTFAADTFIMNTVIVGLATPLGDTTGTYTFSGNDVIIDSGVETQSGVLSGDELDMDGSIYIRQ